MELQLTLSKKQENNLQKGYSYYFLNVSKSDLPEDWNNAVIVLLYKKRKGKK